MLENKKTLGTRLWEVKEACTHFSRPNPFVFDASTNLSCSILHKSFVSIYYLEIYQLYLGLFLLSGYCGNYHKPHDQIVFVHAIDSDKRPIIMHPRMYIFEYI